MKYLLVLSMFISSVSFAGGNDPVELEDCKTISKVMGMLMGPIIKSAMKSEGADLNRSEKKCIKDQMMTLINASCYTAAAQGRTMDQFQRDLELSIQSNVENIEDRCNSEG